MNISQIKSFLADNNNIVSDKDMDLIFRRINYNRDNKLT